MIGTRAVIQRHGADGWEDYLTVHLLKANKHRSREYYGEGGEQDLEQVDFEVRYRKALEPIEFDKPSYRIIWRENIFDIRTYDDYMYQHRKVTLRGACNG